MARVVFVVLRLTYRVILSVVMPLMHQLFAAVSRSRLAEGSLEAIDRGFLAPGCDWGHREGAPLVVEFQLGIALRDAHFT